MKKFLIFMTVLAMASAASARLQISVHTNPPGNETWDPLNPADSEICVNVSETLELDIYSTGGDTGVGWPVGIGYFVLVCDMAKGVIYPYTAVAHIPPAPDATVMLGWAVGEKGMMGGIPEGYDGLAGTIGAYVAMPPYGDGIYVDGIVFHCEKGGDAVISLLEVDMYTWATTGVVYDSVIVHQDVPEPATVLLFGLGGLALLRNRKK